MGFLNLRHFNFMYVCGNSPSATDLEIVHMTSEEGYIKLSRAKSMEECREIPISCFIELFHSISDPSNELVFGKRTRVQSNPRRTHCRQ